MAQAGVAALQCGLPTSTQEKSFLSSTSRFQRTTAPLVLSLCCFESATQCGLVSRVSWKLAALRRSRNWRPDCHRSPSQTIRAELPGGRARKGVVVKQDSKSSRKKQPNAGAKSFWDSIELVEDGPDVVPFAEQSSSAINKLPPVVRASKKDGNTFVYHINGGGRVLASVWKVARRFVVALEVDTKELGMDSATALHLHWGLSRSDSEDWVLLDAESAPPNTTLSGGETEAMRTPILEVRPGLRRIDIPLAVGKTPVELHFVLYQPPTEKIPEKWFRSTKDSNFSVPVGLGRGSPQPLGATWHRDGSVNFALYSRNAEGVVLCLFKPGAVEPSTELDLSPGLHRTGDVWHVQLESVEGYDRYGYRVRGAVGWATGNRFHSRPVLLDPYAHFIAPHVPGQEDLPSPALALGLLQPDEPFDWEGDFPPVIPLEELVAYKLHVGGFTRDASSGVAEAARGTFAGVVDKVQHLVDLGVNAVILQPIAAFDETLGSFFPISFFAPASIYGPGGNGVAASRLLKVLIKELHRAGIEVLLDVVFSHTAEGNDEDPKTVSLRGIDNATYYLVDEFGQFKIPEFGVGNAFNCNNPTAQRMIVDSIRRWVEDFHVDGFCFANAQALVTGPHGQQLSRPLLVEALAFDPVLQDTKLIADLRSPITGVHQPVAFPHWSRWAEWNSRYRDDVRRFIRGEGGQLSAFATRLVGSGDIFDDRRGPAFSFNHVTSPYGYTLADVVSYTGYPDDFRCQNEFGWNAGVEGYAADPGVTEARHRQMRTYLVALFLSQGVPVLTMGDEYGHTKSGNLDVEDRTSVFHWGQVNGPLGRQLKELIARLVAFREEHPELLQRREYLQPHELVWHGYWPAHPEWDNPSSAFLAASLHQFVRVEEPEPEPELEAPGRAPFSVPGASFEEEPAAAADPLAGLEPVGHGDLYIAFNAHADQVTLGLPAPPRGAIWHRLVDTSMPVQSYFVGEGDALHAPPPGASDVVHPHGSYDLAPFSALLLEARFPIGADGLRRPSHELQSNKSAPFSVNVSGF